jgi:hypothetical protein
MIKYCDGKKIILEILTNVEFSSTPEYGKLGLVTPTVCMYVCMYVCVDVMLCMLCMYCDMRIDRMRQPYKPPLLGNGCVTRNNTRAIAKQRTHATFD